MSKHRIVYGITGFILLLFLGMIYAWSIFVAPLEAEFGWVRSQTSLIFSISMIFFCVGNLAAGVITPRTSPRVSILIAAVVICCGFVASSFTSSLPWIYVSYGVACGFAVGLGANVVLSTTLKWFADKQGIASGALLMGFGLGSMALSPFVTMLLTNLGWKHTFVLLGIVFGALLVIGAIICKNPSAEFSAALLEKARKAQKISAKEFTTKEMLKTPVFWIFILWVILVTIGGLALISQAVPAAQDILVLKNMSEAAAVMMATTAMGMISVFNGLGRLGLGVLWDKKGYRVSIMTISIVYAVSMAACAIATKSLSFPILVAGFIILGMSYGASMSACSAMISSFFGTMHYSLNYACASCNLIIAASIGPTLSGFLKTSSGSYFSSFIVILVLALISFVLTFFVKKPQADQEPVPAEAES